MRRIDHGNRVNAVHMVGGITLHVDAIEVEGMNTPRGGILLNDVRPTGCCCERRVSLATRRW
jgi:hypothetical protein